MWNFCRIKNQMKKHPKNLFWMLFFIHLCWYHIQAFDNLLLYSAYLVSHTLLAHFMEGWRGKRHRKTKGLIKFIEKICGRANRELFCHRSLVTHQTGIPCRFSFSFCPHIKVISHFIHIPFVLDVLLLLLK